MFCMTEMNGHTHKRSSKFSNLSGVNNKIAQIKQQNITINIMLTMTIG